MATERRVGSGVVVGQERRPVEVVTLRLELRGEMRRRGDLRRHCLRVDASGGADVNQATVTGFAVGTEEHLDADFFDPVGSFPNRVKVLVAGTYRLSYGLSVASSSGAQVGSIRAFLALNGDSGDVIPGTDSGTAIPANSGSRGFAGASVLADLAANDYVEIYSLRAGTGTAGMPAVAGGSYLQAELVSFDEVPTPRLVIDRPLRLRAARVSKGASGSTGTTTLDVLRNGSSILTTAKLQVDAGEPWEQVGSEAFASDLLETGDEITLDVIDEEDPAARDVGVELLCEAI
jgi:hypothetical protein